jgi:hypothetical protein
MLGDQYERIQTLEKALVHDPDRYANLEVTSISSRSDISHFGNYQPTESSHTTPQSSSNFQTVRRGASAQSRRGDVAEGGEIQRTLPRSATTTPNTMTRTQTITRTRSESSVPAQQANRSPTTPVRPQPLFAAQLTPEDEIWSLDQTTTQQGRTVTNQTETSRQNLCIDPVSGHEVTIEDVGIDDGTQQNLLQPIQSTQSRSSTPRPIERPNGQIDQEAFAAEFHRLHTNDTVNNNLRQNVSRSNAQINVIDNLGPLPTLTSLEGRVETLRRRAHEAEEDSRNIDSLASRTQFLDQIRQSNLDGVMRDPLNHRGDTVLQDTPPPPYESVQRREPRVPMPSGGTNGFQPFRLPPEQSYRAWVDRHTREWPRQPQSSTRLDPEAPSFDPTSHTRPQLSNASILPSRPQERPSRSQIPFNSTRSSFAVERAAERAAREELEEAERRRIARQYAREYATQARPETDGLRLEAHIVEDPVTRLPRRTLDPCYGYDQSYNRRSSSYHRAMNRPNASAQGQNVQNISGPRQQNLSNRPPASNQRARRGTPDPPDPGDSDPDSNGESEGWEPLRRGRDSDHGSDHRDRRPDRGGRPPGRGPGRDPDPGDPNPNPGGDNPNRRRRDPNPRRRNDLVDSDFTSSDEEVMIPDHLPGRWYRQQFPGPWCVKPYKATTREDKYRSLTNIKIEKFAGDPHAYADWSSKVIAQIHRNPTTWHNKLTAIEAAIDFKAAPLKVFHKEVAWTPQRYVNLIRWLDQRFGGATTTIAQHMDKILALPKCSKNMMELEALHSLAAAHRSLLQAYQRYNVSECERLFVEVRSRLHDHWDEQYHSQVDTSPDGNGYGEQGQLGLESLLRYMDKKLADWRAQKLYSARSIPKSKTDKSGDSQKTTSSRVHVATSMATSEIQDYEPCQPTESSAMAYYGQGSNQTRFGQNNSQKGQYKPKDAQQKTSVEGASMIFKPKPPGCPCCGGDHDLGYNCPTFVNASMAKRRTIAADAKVCYKCLLYDHFLRNCPKKKTCPHCGKNHHELLHYEGKKVNKVFCSFVDAVDPISLAFVDQDSSCDEEESQVHPTMIDTTLSEKEVVTEPEVVAQANVGISSNSTIDKDIPDISLRVVAIKIRNHQTKQTTTVNVLLDEGADRSYLDESVAEKLRLRGAAHRIVLNGAGGKTTKFKTIKTLAYVQSTFDPQVNRKVLFTILPKSVGDVQYTSWAKSKQYWDHLRNIQDVIVAPGTVVGIIGGLDADLLAALQADITGSAGDPVARRCKLGWTILGKTNPDLNWSEDQTAQAIQEAQGKIFKCIQNNVQLLDGQLTQSDADCFTTFEFEQRKQILDSDLNELVKKQMEIETLPDDEEKQLSRDDRYAQQVMQRTMRQLPDGQYECGALWKKGEPQMPNNLSYALKRHQNFLQMKSMQKPDVKKGVQDSINDWLANGFIRRVPPEERWPKRAFYLPIFVVSRAEAETTKHRVVLQ